MTMSGRKSKPNFGGGAMANDDEYWASRRRRKVVSVTVSGPVGCGKSAVAGIIEDALKAAGVAVQQDKRLDTERNMCGGDWSKDVAMYEPMATIVERIEYPPKLRWWQRVFK